MLILINNIRKRINKGHLTKYAFYAIGEVVLIVIGIVIALEINIILDQRKTKNSEIFILEEVLSNLEFDRMHIEEILVQRNKTQISIMEMLSYLESDKIDKVTFENDLVQLLTFERYFPFRTAYEVAKAQGLPITDQELRHNIADYYEFEQYKVRNSIQDIEKHYFQTIDTEMKHHLHEFNYGQSIKVKNFPNPELIDWIKNLLIAFRVYNTQSINEIELFLKTNSELKNEINEVIKFN